MQLDIADSILCTFVDASPRISWFRHEEDARVSAQYHREASHRCGKEAHQSGRTPYCIHQSPTATGEGKSNTQVGRLVARNPRTCQTYRTACTEPPDGRLHPILRIQQSDWEEKSSCAKKKGQLLRDKASRGEEFPFPNP